MAYAEATDVATRSGRTLTSEETSLVETRLEDAERRIKHRIPDLADQIEAEMIDVEDVKQVEAEAVLRLVRNPDGYISETDGTYGYQFSRELASGKLQILPEDWAVLGITAPVAVLVPTFTESLTTPTVNPFMTGG